MNFKAGDAVLWKRRIHGETNATFFIHCAVARVERARIKLSVPLRSGDTIHYWCDPSELEPDSE